MAAEAHLGQRQGLALEQRRAAFAATRSITETCLGHAVDGIALRADDLDVRVYIVPLRYGMARAAAGLARSQSWIGCQGPKRC